VQAVCGGPVGLYPIVTSQYSSTALYQVFYHTQQLFFESDNRIFPTPPSQPLSKCWQHGAAGGAPVVLPWPKPTEPSAGVAVHLGLYPIVTLQYSSTTLYQVSDLKYIQ
jgi:hypothetical protein